MFKHLLLTSLCFVLVIASQQNSSFEKMKGEFDTYKSTQDINFKAYQKAHFDAINSYKKELKKFWDSTDISTQNEIVSYTPDKQTRTKIDFKNEEIIIETFAKSIQEANEKLKIALAKAVTIDTKTLLQTDPLEKKLLQLKQPNKTVTSPIQAKPILTPIIFSKQPTKENVFEYVNKHLDEKNIKVMESTKIKHSKIYTTRVKMPPKSILKRSKIYYDDVKKESQTHNIPMPLIFAIIHSESSFNPLARSHVPAFGLMQIVPRTAGVDAYFFLYNKEKLPSSSYLYNAQNNIKMGTAYLHILYYRYLKDIEDEDSRLYCTIAAYNTGAGNVAWAFTKNNNIKSAVKTINTMQSSSVYHHLLKHLKYDEPKHYLQNVTKRMPIYHKLYGV